MLPRNRPSGLARPSIDREFAGRLLARRRTHHLRLCDTYGRTHCKHNSLILRLTKAAFSICSRLGGALGLAGRKPEKRMPSRHGSRCSKKTPAFPLTTGSTSPKPSLSMPSRNRSLGAKRFSTSTRTPRIERKKTFLSLVCLCPPHG